MEVDNEKALYKIGTTLGVLKCLFSRRQIDVCQETFIIFINDVPTTSNDVSVREAHGKTAVTASQAFNNCNWKFLSDISTWCFYAIYTLYGQVTVDTKCVFILIFGQFKIM